MRRRRRGVFVPSVVGTSVAALLAGCARPPTPSAAPPPPPEVSAPGAEPDPPAEPGPATTREEVMSLTHVRRLTFSADRAHALAEVQDERGAGLALDGREVACCHSAVRATALAPDGASVSFLASPKDVEGFRTSIVHHDRATVVDGDAAALAVTPDGAHLAYAVSFPLQGSSAVVVDGVRVSSGFAPRQLTLSNDGGRWAVVHDVARSGGGETITIDGRTSAPSGSIWGVVFSPDHSHVAYVTTARDGSERLVLDGRVSGPFDRVDHDLAFTADGRLVAEVSHGGSLHLRIGSVEHRSGGPLERVVAGDSVIWIDELDEGGHHFARALVDGIERFRLDCGVRDPLGRDDHGPAIHGLVVAPGGETFAFATSEGVHVADARGVRRVWGLGTPVAFDADASHLAVDVRSPNERGLEAWSLRGAPAPVRGPRFSPSDELHVETVRWVGGAVTYFANRGGTLVRESFSVP